MEFATHANRRTSNGEHGPRDGNRRDYLFVVVDENVVQGVVRCE